MDTESVTEVLQIAQHAEDLDRARDVLHPSCSARSRLGLLRPARAAVLPGRRRSGCCWSERAPSALIYLKVDDVAATVESLRADGVEIVAEPHVIFTHTDDRLGPAGTEERMAFFRDSEGNTVGLVSHRPDRRPTA